MGTGMLIILAMGAAFGGWSALAVMGAERARRLSQLEAQRPVVPTVISSTAPSGSAAPRPRTLVDTKSSGR